MLCWGGLIFLPFPSKIVLWGRTPDLMFTDKLLWKVATLVFIFTRLTDEMKAQLLWSTWLLDWTTTLSLCNYIVAQQVCKSDVWVWYRLVELVTANAGGIKPTNFCNTGLWALWSTLAGNEFSLRTRLFYFNCQAIFLDFQKFFIFELIYFTNTSLYFNKVADHK